LKVGIWEKKIGGGGTAVGLGKRGSGNGRRSFRKNNFQKKKQNPLGGRHRHGDQQDRGTKGIAWRMGASGNNGKTMGSNGS